MSRVVGAWVLRDSNAVSKRVLWQTIRAGRAR